MLIWCSKKCNRHTINTTTSSAYWFIERLMLTNMSQLVHCDRSFLRHLTTWSGESQLLSLRHLSSVAGSTAMTGYTTKNILPQCCLLHILFIARGHCCMHWEEANSSHSHCHYTEGLGPPYSVSSFHCKKAANVWCLYCHQNDVSCCGQYSDDFLI